ncbi:MAG: ABC-F family ATP-binding cassette domain-containing protein, partial [Candidatus Cloacimonetes bacterium]|nr:ABC-F family ATP-binding cassette domain-containing protein [Candidatus Cloacimonadota bacterium]
MAEITINHLKKSYGAHQVFTDLNLEVNKKDRVGLVGRNGSGKTTIFRLIAGLENYQFGKISLTRNKTIGYLEQNPVYHSKKPVIEILKQGLADILKLKNKLEDISHKMQNEEGKKLKQLMRQYNSLQTEFEMKDGYNLKVKLQKVCEGLKIPSQMQEKNFETLSGGEKTRVLLAKMLLKNPDILLMDEPTNHL